MRRLLLGVTLVLVGRHACAESGTSTIAVTATLVGSVSFTVETAGGTASGTGTSAASTNLGAMSKYGTAPPGFVLTRTASSWTLTSTIGIKVAQANLDGEGFSLYASLATPPPSGVTWQLGSFSTTLSTTSALIDNFGQFGSVISVSWTIGITDGAAASALNNSIALVVVSY